MILLIEGRNMPMLGVVGEIDAELNDDDYESCWWLMMMKLDRVREFSS